MTLFKVQLWTCHLDSFQNGGHSWSMFTNQLWIYDDIIAVDLKAGYILQALSEGCWHVARSERYVQESITFPIDKESLFLSFGAAGSYQHLIRKSIKKSCSDSYSYWDVSCVTGMENAPLIVARLSSPKSTQHRTSGLIKRSIGVSLNDTVWNKSCTCLRILSLTFFIVRLCALFPKPNLPTFYPIANSLFMVHCREQPKVFLDTGLHVRRDTSVSPPYHTRTIPTGFQLSRLLL